MTSERTPPGAAASGPASASPGHTRGWRLAGEPEWIGAVLRFWFEELTPQAWFKRSDVLDEAIRQRFAATVAEVAGAPDDTLLRSAGSALAAIIALDQFPRNIFRGSGQAFATDAKARALAAGALDRGFDRSLDKHGRLFLYLPFEHSEDLADQRRSVALLSALGDDELTRYAEAHRVIIERFGRFPHRNLALARVSTSEELEFLKGPGSSF